MGNCVWSFVNISFVLVIIVFRLDLGLEVFSTVMKLDFGVLGNRLYVIYKIYLYKFSRILYIVKMYFFIFYWIIFVCVSIL